ncbi:hypothetical protein PVAP13_1NG198619 [Panicum virgatum]|uniref:Uncharacterized protein n=1 Tax=Panicum virgatum TaxID=38727 RepID=A0A8T0WXB9_PANVG|nr:hypothetical protein PVAP13_1NG198619 [Panicum virgatum]KAG2650262.1 hypothetical protein PVAP13_1NG198619 [Panicum virgatum]KAG2650263.1 hypothetical protein PVAP13_1NG198619 [Panicum virgatum]KAG2650264.1 hypothetical protein PVAP13_1NG198619 [Panicum virgatum]KAG2650265.1 hypothetical protein PVAP13_1NG198619 [Panicum virgatum]
MFGARRRLAPSEPPPSAMRLRPPALGPAPPPSTRRRPRTHPDQRHLRLRAPGPQRPRPRPALADPGRPAPAPDQRWFVASETGGHNQRERERERERRKQEDPPAACAIPSRGGGDCPVRLPCRPAVTTPRGSSRMLLGSHNGFSLTSR